MDNELKNSEEYLRSKSLDAGFSAPESYFDSIEDAFSAKLREENLPKGHGYTAPDTYFEELEARIIDNVIQPKETKVIPLRRRVLQLIPAAAAAVIALMVVFNLQDNFEEVSTEEIANWFESDIYRITSDDLSLALEDLDLEDDVVTSIDEDAIENYLENIDTTPLLDEIN